MKLAVTIEDQGGQTFNAAQDIPGGADAPPHVLTNAVVQSVSTQMNMLAGANLRLKRLSVGVED